MKRPFFSIIIPTLNEEKYLPTVLLSLAGQTFLDFEVVVVDGSSVDDTYGVFKKYKKFLPKVMFFNSEVRNVSLQRNLGARMSRGSYLIFFDADVAVKETFLEEIYKIALKENFALGTTWIRGDSKKFVNKIYVFFANIVWEIARKINFPLLSGYNTIVKRSTFQKLAGFNKKITIGEDIDFAARALQKGIKLQLFRLPRLTASMRRYEMEGMFNLLIKYAILTGYTFFKGPITHKIDYPMGGHVYLMPKKIK